MSPTEDDCEVFDVFNRRVVAELPGSHVKFKYVIWFDKAVAIFMVLLPRTIGRTDDCRIDDWPR
jgi:hypothetical protein